MDFMNEGILNGVCVIIDDEVEKEGKSSHNLAKSIRAAGIPVALFDDIPDDKTIDSFGNVSYVILDWVFKNKDVPAEAEESEELKEEAKAKVLEFLRKLQERIFVPVFLITEQNIDNVEDDLVEGNVYSREEPNLIMIRSKNSITDYDTLMENTQHWLEEMPSAQVLKIWEKNATEAKHNMFIELYKASSSWVSVIKKTIEDDMQGNTIGINYEFQKLINNNFINRMKSGDYATIRCDYIDQSSDVIRKVLEGERYIKYDKEPPNVYYVGDLYKNEENGDYYLNIRAQCNLIREDDPLLYVIRGVAYDIEKIAKKPKIKMQNNGEENVIEILQKKYTISELKSYDKKRRSEFNCKMSNMEQTTLFNLGELISKNCEAFVSCIADQHVIQFCFKQFEIKKAQEFSTEARRIGRLIPPYITKIQQEFSAYIIREGLMPLPESLFFDS